MTSSSTPTVYVVALATGNHETDGYAVAVFTTRELAEAYASVRAAEGTRCDVEVYPLFDRLPGAGEDTFAA